MLLLFLGCWGSGGGVWQRGGLADKVLGFRRLVTLDPTLTSCGISKHPAERVQNRGISP